MANEWKYLAIYVISLLLNFQYGTSCDYSYAYAYGYMNVKETSSDDEFLMWVLSSGLINPSGYVEVGPTKTYDDVSCYWLARGGYTNDRALLLSPCYTTTSTSSNVVLSFAYFLYGDNAGTLKTYMRQGCVSAPNLMLNDTGNIFGDSLMGSQKNRWVATQRETNAQPNTFQIIFEATMMGTEAQNNSIAIDAISVSNVTLPPASTPMTQATAVDTTAPIVLKTSYSSTNVLTTPANQATNHFTSSISLNSVASSDASSTLFKDESTTVDMTSIAERTSTKQVADVTLTQVTSIDNVTSSAINGTMSNATLNFCDANLIIKGLDNCTFIGLMFAIVPLGLIFLIWLVCCTYNRYIRNVGQSDKRQQGDAESSVGKDNYLSNSYAYINSTTDHTYAYIPGNVNATESDNNRKPDGVTTHSGNSVQSDEVTVQTSDKVKEPIGKLDENRKQSKDSDYSSSDEAHIYEKSVKKGSEVEGKTNNEDDEEHSETNEDSGEPLYNVLDGLTPELDDEQPKDISLPSNQDSAQTCKDVASVEKPDVTDESPYHVLEGSSPPSPPRTSVPRRKSRKTNADKSADEGYEKVEINNSDDGFSKDVVLSSALPKTTSSDAIQVRKSCIEPYADSMVGKRDEMSPEVDEHLNGSEEESNYETIAKTEDDDDDGYDDPRLILVARVDSTEAVESDAGDDDTYL